MHTFPKNSSVLVRASVALILTLSQGCVHDKPQESRFAARIGSTFGLSLPCSLVSGGIHLDGGSMGVILLGAKGDSLAVAWSGTFRMPEPPTSILHDRPRLKVWADSIVNAQEMPAYVGADWFRAPGAVPIAIGSPKESLLIDILRSCAGRDSSSSFNPLLGAMAGHSYPPPAFFAWRIIRFLEEQRARSSDKSARRLN
jgi:hypothetical protein